MSDVVCRSLQYTNRLNYGVSHDLDDLALLHPPPNPPKKADCGIINGSAAIAKLVVNERKQAHVIYFDFMICLLALIFHNKQSSVNIDNKFVLH